MRIQGKGKTKILKQIPNNGKAERGYAKTKIRSEEGTDRKYETNAQLGKGKTGYIKKDAYSGEGKDKKYETNSKSRQGKDRICKTNAH